MLHHHNSLPRLLVSVSLLALIAGCAVGPDFKPPDKPGVDQYDSSATPDKTDSAEGTQHVAAAVAQNLQPGGEVPGEWWELFHSESLNKLVEQALKSNPDIAAQRAALRAANEQVLAGEGALFPSVSGAAGITRQKVPGSAYAGDFPSLIYTLNNASVSVSYQLDVFGGIRREIEEISAQRDYQRFEMEATTLSITANVVTAAIQEASLRGQIASTQKIIDEEQKETDVLQRQFELGGISKAGVLEQQTTLEQERATLPPLEKQLAITRHELSALVGQFPSEPLIGQFDLASLSLPDTLPVSLPSDLVEQRPDIMAAEATLHSTSAAIGVAISNRLPQIQLSADIGSEANEISKLFTPGSGLWSYGFNATQTIFDAGTLAHDQYAAEAQFDEAKQMYRQTVLAAFQNVADTLRALQSDATALKAEVAAERAASDSLKLSEAQFHDGAISYLALVDAEHAEQQTELALVQAEAMRYADSAALLQALGGGWWKRSDNPATQPATQGDTSIMTHIFPADPNPPGSN